MKKSHKIDKFVKKKKGTKSHKLVRKSHKNVETSAKKTETWQASEKNH